MSYKKSNDIKFGSASVHQNVKIYSKDTIIETDKSLEDKRQLLTLDLIELVTSSIFILGSSSILNKEFDCNKTKDLFQEVEALALKHKLPVPKRIYVNFKLIWEAVKKHWKGSKLIINWKLEDFELNVIISPLSKKEIPIKINDEQVVTSSPSHRSGKAESILAKNKDGMIVSVQQNIIKLNQSKYTILTESEIKEYYEKLNT